MILWYLNINFELDPPPPLPTPFPQLLKSRLRVTFNSVQALVEPLAPGSGSPKSQQTAANRNPSGTKALSLAHNSHLKARLRPTGEEKHGRRAREGTFKIERK